MATVINRNAFCADYNELTSCLLAIQTAANNGMFNGHPEVLGLIRVFENDTLRKLYLRTIRILGILYGVDDVPSYINVKGDFEEIDFSKLDFWVGYSDSNVGGDFYEIDFTELDFWIGFSDSQYADYVAVFQTILNIFKEFCKRSNELSDFDKTALDAAFIPVLDALEELRTYLNELGFELCGSVGDATTGNNTPGVFLQAAGSDGIDGIDGIAEGLHLRWSFTGDMAALHLPKGDYFPIGTPANGYNKPNDFIQISRIPYASPVQVIVDFEYDRPIVNSLNLYWTYTANQTVNGIRVSNRIRLRFTNRALYYQLARLVNPSNNYFEFLKQYSAVIEIEIINKTAFSYTFEVGTNNISSSSILKIEALANFDKQSDDDDTFVRKTLILESASASTTILADNMSRVRLKKTQPLFLRRLLFETYHDFLATRNQNEWVTVGNGFALSTLDEIVFDRLEDTAYQIDNLWPLYNEGTRVKVANYQERWSVSHENEPSLKELIQQYLVKSETDPRANLEIFEEGFTTDGQMISLLDAVQLNALDYHIARMFGFGHIDTPANVSANERFVYRLTYSNKESMDSSVTVNYSYMSLPVSKLDKRLPEKPQMRPVTYNLFVENQDYASPFDENGYGKLDNVRVVNLGRGVYNDELPDHDFFTNLNEIENSNIFEIPRPVLYGIEYRPDGQTNYVKPEITSVKPFGKIYYAYDNDFPEIGVPEPILSPDDVDSLYIHFERQIGVHHYALYGVNWFSRASLSGLETATDTTDFPLRNTLSPPSNLAAQYVQKEEALIFTTGLEQGWLAGRNNEFTGGDVSFTRLTFNWLDITDITALADDTTPERLQNVVKPNQTNVFFRTNFPFEVVGIITNVIPVPSVESRAILLIGPYQLITGEIITPTIPNADFNRFKNSVLTTPIGQFRVIEINATSSFPTITIEKIYDTVRVDGEDSEDGSTIFGSRKEYISPEIGSRFTIVENLGDSANWQEVEEKIQLVSFANEINPVIDTILDSEGNESKFWIGGITGNAIISKIYDEENEFSGYYQIIFENTVSLAPHPQINIPFDPADPSKNAPGQLHTAHVEWYKGQVRLLTASADDKKMLQVEVVNQTTELTLVVYDPMFDSDPIITSQNAIDHIEVNFHPGYRVYLFPEPAPAYVFNREHILPQGDENDRRTLIGIQNQDTLNSGFTTSVSSPVVLLARNIYEPQQMDAPMAPNLKVRPDATAKAAFTFDMRIGPLSNGDIRRPFGFMFYRTTHVDILQALFKPETIAVILDELAMLTEDPYFNLRYLDLSNLVFDPQNNMHFKVYEAMPSPYGFPVPDKEGLVEAEDSDALKIGKYKLAIQTGLLPLTEQPPIYKYIKQGYQTSNNLPVIRDVDGNLMNAASPKFDPFPMIRHFTKESDANASYIRTTDYFLNASSRDFYFYAGAEISNLLATGPLSLFVGPVEILHTSPAEAPIVSSFSVMPPPIADLDEVTVVFKIAAMPISDNISKIRVYRTTELTKTVSINQMENEFDTIINPEEIAGYEVTDTFADFTIIPLGKTIYYRLVGVRVIINEFEQEEEVLSLSTNVIAIKLIDTRNPDAPDLAYSQAQNELSWPPTTIDGTYYLYKQNAKANWERVYSAQPPSTNEEMVYTLPDTLEPEDEDGNKIYHRFKVQVQNASGLLNLTENEKTIETI
ncbi:hypothetical protein [Pedobacter frigiditerrae]|uniref:hypothetical protein n=1 Tax=Pedobacter frigiditerrae TaxID=2530452 RepID=UPI00292F5A80|nr:hypothetical protein [Pedobacter frigiditerrae]